MHNLRHSVLGIIIILTVFVSISVPALISSQARAQHSQKDAPNLVGIWKSGKVIVAHQNGKMSVMVELRIAKQEGQYFWGEKSWKNLDPENSSPGHLHTKDKHVYEAVESIIGIIDLDGKTIYIAEHDDLGTMHATLMDKDRMNITHIEHGAHALIFTTILTRVK